MTPAEEEPPQAQDVPVPEDDFDTILDPTYIPVPDETFAQRRRRFAQQETGWIRRNRPSTEPQRPVHEEPTRESHGRQKRARQDEGPDLELNADLLFDKDGTTPLPEGWYFDPASQEFYLGETQDYWSFEDGFLARNHVIGRVDTFQATEFPVDINELQTTTGLTLQKGSRQVYVNEEDPVYLGSSPWFGRTLYPLTKQAAEDHGQHYVGDFSQKISTHKTIRCRGHRMLFPRRKPSRRLPIFEKAE